MFKRKPNPRLVEIDMEITRVLAVLARMEPDDEEYLAAVSNWALLCDQRDTLLSNRFSKDQMLVVGGNILIAVLVIGYERGAVITTKLPSFLGKVTR